MTTGEKNNTEKVNSLAMSQTYCLMYPNGFTLTYSNGYLYFIKKIIKMHTTFYIFNGIVTDDICKFINPWDYYNQKYYAISTYTGSQLKGQQEILLENV